MPKSKHRKNHKQKLTVYKRKMVDGAKTWSKFLGQKLAQAQSDNFVKKVEEVGTPE